MYNPVNRYLKYILVLLAVFYLSGCRSDAGGGDFFLVKVIGKGVDCNETYLVKFQEEDEERVSKYLEEMNTHFPVFYANNLPEKFKEKGRTLKVKLYECQQGELPLCTAKDPGFGSVCIESATAISLAMPWMLF